MTETEFLELARETLDAIEAAAEHITQSTDTDIDTGRSGNVLTLTFENGSKIIVNSQAPMQQMWVAARSGGFHYGWDGQAWIDTRDGSELFAALSRHASSQAGTALLFTA